MPGAMNPFTKSIASHLRAPALRAFIEHWDRLETLVIRVFRADAALPADDVDYNLVRAWLQQHYTAWQGDLDPLWRQALRGGKPSEDDPFLFLLAPQSATIFIGSRAHMQALPAAREALNRLILARSSPARVHNERSGADSSAD